MSQAGDALGDRPDPIEPQGIDGQAAQCGQDLNAVVLPVEVGVFGSAPPSGVTQEVL